MKALHLQWGGSFAHTIVSVKEGDPALSVQSPLRHVCTSWCCCACVALTLLVEAALLLVILASHTQVNARERAPLSSYYSRYTYSSHSSGYNFLFSLKVLGFRVRVRIRIRGLGDQNYEVEFETIGTVTQNYANFDYSGYFSFLGMQDA